MLASRERRDTSVALTSTFHWFETDVLTGGRFYSAAAVRLTEHNAPRMNAGTTE